MMSKDHSQPNYKVLARKYRPQQFLDLVGQDTLVKILVNALANKRLAQAYLFTGIRGVGKTTTARILAKAANCTGSKNTNTPQEPSAQQEPCNQCSNCIAITAGNHIDVLEMDAASHTGVGDIRDITDSLQYRPLQAQYKIIILDEVHMLSNSAFNALLKTLEDPPEHVIFMLATTELRKVPVTVLSRCQRFDLIRVPIVQLKLHYQKICTLEDVTISENALNMIAHASDGSVRDGLSLLDQAISLSANEHTITEAEITSMLGLQDRDKIFELISCLLAGKLNETLNILTQLLNHGGDSIQICQDLLNTTYWLTRLKVSAQLIDNHEIPELERKYGPALTENISLATITRIWQALLKTLHEIQISPNARQALEIGIIRLAHLGTMPPPGELLEKIMQYTNTNDTTSSNNASNSNASSSNVHNNLAIKPQTQSDTSTQSNLDKSTLKKTAEIDQATDVALVESIFDDQSVEPQNIDRFEDVVRLAYKSKEAQIYNSLMHDVHLIAFETGKISLRLDNNAPAKLIQQLASMLEKHTNFQWSIASEQVGGDMPLAQTLKAKALHEPIVTKLLKHFPESEIIDIQPNWLDNEINTHNQGPLH